MKILSIFFSERKFDNLAPIPNIINVATFAGYQSLPRVFLQAWHLLRSQLLHTFHGLYVLLQKSKLQNH